MFDEVKYLKRIANCLHCLHCIYESDLTMAERKIAFVLVEAGYLKEVQVSDTLKICGYEPMPRNSVQYQTT